jgi:hypothetical protein
MAGLVPAIYDLRRFNRLKSWMTGARPVMTDKQWSPLASRGISFSIETAANSFHTVCLCRPSTALMG